MLQRQRKDVLTRGELGSPENEPVLGSSLWGSWRGSTCRIVEKKASQIIRCCCNIWWLASTSGSRIAAGACIAYELAPGARHWRLCHANRRFTLVRDVTRSPRTESRRREKACEHPYKPPGYRFFLISFPTTPLSSRQLWPPSSPQSPTPPTAPPSASLRPHRSLQVRRARFEVLRGYLMTGTTSVAWRLCRE